MAQTTLKQYPNWTVFCICALFVIALQTCHAQRTKTKGWPDYGGTLAGQRYSSARQINRENVNRLQVAWTFQTHALDAPASPLNKRASFEATPVLWKGTLYFDSPFNAVFAVDAQTGRIRWEFDPKVDRAGFINVVTSRGVALWRTSKRIGVRGTCSNRAFVATLDARLIALDALSGKPCDDFGLHGTVDLAEGVHLGEKRWWYECTSAPTVVGNVVVVGSSVSDNQAVEEPSGAVRGFDARSGRLLWSWEPLPWAQNQHPRTGAGNAWSTILADPKSGLIFVPTGSPSPDFYGGYRSGDNRDADSVVALDAVTGKRVWGFQIVHHDLWDYDVAAEPVLFQFRKQIPAVAIATKTGMVFVLNRQTGVPLYPVYEKPVPQSDISGEKTSATQPFSSLPNLAPVTFNADEVFGASEKDRKFCHDKVAALVNQGIFTPVSTASTLLYPGSIGGVEWGSPTVDPNTGILYSDVNNVAFDARLVPRSLAGNGLLARIDRKFHKWMLYWRPASQLPADLRFQAPDTAGRELSEQAGTPYRIFREALVGPDGLPCTPQPWGSLVAMNLNTGTKLWSVPLGTMIAGQHTGSVTSGGPIVTAGGLIFSASGSDPFLRAFDAATGRELWRGALPGPANATPMTYEWRGRQYIVIADGGDGTPDGGQALIAFALPETAIHGHSRPSTEGEASLLLN